MEKMIKTIALVNQQTLISEIGEVGAVVPMPTLPSFLIVNGLAL